MRRLSMCTILTAVALSVSAAESTVYQWVDANGVVHYSDTGPGDGGEHKRLQLRQPNLLSSDTLADFPDLAGTAEEAPRKPTAVLISGGGAEIDKWGDDPHYESPWLYGNNFQYFRGVGRHHRLSRWRNCDAPRRCRRAPEHRHNPGCEHRHGSNRRQKANLGGKLHIAVPAFKAAGSR